MLFILREDIIRKMLGYYITLFNTCENKTPWIDIYQQLISEFVFHRKNLFNEFLI